MFLKIVGELHYLLRAIDQHGVVLDILVQGRRDATAAKRFFQRLLVGLMYRPRRLVIDGLRSYGVAHREVMPEVKHWTSRYLNNRAENSHRPTRRRERQTQHFKSPAQAQRLLSSHAMIYGHFRPRRHLMTAGKYRHARAQAFQLWREETRVQAAACCRATDRRTAPRVTQSNNLAMPHGRAPQWQVSSEVLGITIYSHRKLEQLLRAFSAAYNARPLRVLKGKTPDQVVAERFKAHRKLTRGEPEGRAGPADIARARDIVEAAKDVSQPDS